MANAVGCDAAGEHASTLLAAAMQTRKRKSCFHERAASILEYLTY
jgi:hypothetical protein